jgi:hypothetical protein
MVLELALSVRIAKRMGSSTSKPIGSSNRKHPEEEDVALEAPGQKKARMEPRSPVEDKMITVVVGETEFQESLCFLTANSGYIKGLYQMSPALDRIEMPSGDPNHWELVTSVLKPFSGITMNQENYYILLPWLDALQCTDGLMAADDVIEKMIVMPLLAKKQSDRSKDDVTHIVAVLGLCVDNNRSGPISSCIRFLLQMLRDPNQPFEAEDIICILRLIVKSEACQLKMWSSVRRYLPSTLDVQASFSKDLVNLVLDNPLLLDVIEANMKIRGHLHQNGLDGLAT